MIKKVESALIGIGWYQIIGGSIGVILILYLFATEAEIENVAIAIYAISALFFLYSIICGVLCLNKKNSAFAYSLVNQLLQLIGFAFGGFAFIYIAGLYMSIGIDLSNSIDLNFSAGVSKFEFNINREQGRVEVSVNLISLWVIYWIDKLRKRNKEVEATSKIMAIGNE